MLRHPTLEKDYEQAWEEWSEIGESDAWETASATLRGEIWEVDFDPVRGNEANQRRPAVIVSNDRANGVTERLRRGLDTVVPVSSNTDRIYPFQVLLPAPETGLRVDSKAHAGQIRSVAAQRLIRRIGRVSAGEITDLDNELRLHLAL